MIVATALIAPTHQLFMTTSIKIIARSAILASTIILTACGSGDDRGTPGPSAQDWPSGLVPPIDGATFSLSTTHLPGAPREYRNGIHQGFDFFDGVSGRPLAADEPIVAIADGEVVRIDHAFEDPAPELLQHWAESSNEPGFLGEFALDQLRGRQVWLRHADGHISRYAHLSMVHPELQPGDQVEQGQPIGLMGNSGVPPTRNQPEPAPHLHFELWSPNGERHLGQDLSPLESHRMIADLFGLNALPRYARRVVQDVNAGETAPERYPPDELPEVGFSVNPPDSLVPGKPFAIAITWDDDNFQTDDFVGFLEDMPAGILDAGNGAWLLGAIPLDHSSEELRVTVAATDPYGQTLVGSGGIQPSDRPSPPPPIEIDRRSLDLHTDDNLQAEANALSNAIGQSLRLTDPQWQEAFDAPTNGPIVQHFGQRSFHGMSRPAHPLPGVLATVEAGSPALASNDGTVVLIEDLPIRGRTVAIAHGGGLLSVYAHLEAVQVEPGETVTRNQRIGTAGQTGAVSSPSLRWEMFVGGVPSDPLDWLDEILPGRHSH